MQGNSTRQVNQAVELLQQGHEILVGDHHEEGENLDANMELREKIRRRFGRECLGKLRIDPINSLMRVEL